VTGFITAARDQKDFAGRVLSLVESPGKLKEMRLKVLNERIVQTWEEAAVRMFGA